MRDLFETTIERLLADKVTPELSRACDAGQWAPGLWAALAESGFAVAASPEALGGAGASWEDLVVVVRACGRHNLPLPLPETLLANALLGECGLEAINAPLGIAGRRELTLYRGRASGVVRDVPWGRHVGQVVAVTAGDDPMLVVLARETAHVTTRLNTAGEPRDDLAFDDVVPSAIVPLPHGMPADVLELGGALVRGAQIGGAVQAVLDLALRYAGERVQFGKPLGAFQAIQHQIAVLSEHSAAIAVAAECAFAESADGAAGFARLPIAAARVCGAEAAGLAAAVGHAVHGAIGFTHEHALHLSTRRLWSWRSEFGNSTWWASQLGQRACEAGGAGLWPLITRMATSP